MGRGLMVAEVILFVPGCAEKLIQKACYHLDNPPVPEIISPTLMTKREIDGVISYQTGVADEPQAPCMDGRQKD